MLHRNGALRNRLVGKSAGIDTLFLERPVPQGQRIETFEQPLPVLFRCDRLADAQRRQPEFLQRLHIELDRHRLRRIEETRIDGELLVGGIVMLEIQCLLRDMLHPEGTVIDIVFQLVRVRRTAPLTGSIRIAPAGQRPVFENWVWSQS